MILAEGITEKSAARRIAQLVFMLNDIDYELQKLFAPDEMLNELHNSICDIADELSWLEEDFRKITEKQDA